MPPVSEALATLRIAKFLGGLLRPPQKLRGLTGEWWARFQREDDPHLGEWVADKVRIEAKWPRSIRFTSFGNSVSQHEAVGRFVGECDIVGVWRETKRAASARGTFHLYADPFGRRLYGICTGPTSSRSHIYGGWVLAQEEADLDAAQEALLKAVLICRPPATGAAHARPGRR